MASTVVNVRLPRPTSLPARSASTVSSRLEVPKADKVRVAALERLGWRVLVVTWDDVVHRRGDTLDRIAMALAERRLLALGA
jgi:hypothetical protein